MPARALPTAARTAMAMAGSLLRVFAPDDHATLWLPAPLGELRIAPVDGLPEPRIETGTPPADAEVRDLWWGQMMPPAGGDDERGATLADNLWEQVWQLPGCDPLAAARANHRGTCLQIARDLDVDLPGSQLVSSADELAAALDAWNAAQPLVLKAAWSAAGRDRVIGLPDAISGDATKLQAAHRELLLEPWMDRTADVGSLALIGEDVCLLGIHQLDVDARGRFLGITINDGDNSHALSPGQVDHLQTTTRSTAAALHALGYRGPVGIDAWLYRDPTADDGRAAILHPLGEINARMSFGLVARALIQRLNLTGRVTLRLRPPSDDPQSPGTRIIPLVLDAVGRAVVHLEHQTPD